MEPPWKTFVPKIILNMKMVEIWRHIRLKEIRVRKRAMDMRGACTEESVRIKDKRGLITDLLCVYMIVCNLPPVPLASLSPTPVP